jgi:starch-binding outer membrane protein, SusD/RagB family
MKKTIYVIILMVFTMVSCEDVFDRQPLDKISDAIVWNDPVMLRAYLSDVYSRMPFNTRLQHAGLDTQTDLATTNKGNQTSITTGAMSRTTDAIAFWNYALIRDVNIFIERIGEATIIQSRKDQMEGEARVLRAMLYFEKQRRYGGVPLVDVPLDPFNPIDQQYTRRSTEEAIADFIDADLTAAIALLTEDPSSIGMINKWTAYAVKARANLWSASIAKYGGTPQLNGLVGIPAPRANEFYTKASAAAKAVIDSEKYSLYNQSPNDKSENYRQLFITDNNGETILSKVYDGVNVVNAWNEYNLPQSIAGGRGSWDNPLYDYIVATEKIGGGWDPPQIGPENLYDYAYQAFEDRDPRIKAIVFFDGDEYEGVEIRSYEGIDPSQTPDPGAILNTWGATYQGMDQVAEDSRMNPFDDKATRSGFMVKKYTKGLGRSPGAVNWMEYRLAEMFLTRAEAEFELGNLPEAATALNKTRARAGISLVDAGTITLNHVRTERMSELAWELHRWWDLRRWRIAEETLNGKTMQGLRTILHFPTKKIYYLPVNAEPAARIFLPHHYYNSITDGRINNNLDLVENPGY